MTTDPLYYRRLDLANRLVVSLKDGIAHAFTLFAPRRMGKTDFLRNDIMPVATEQGFRVFYFSFMDVDHDSIVVRFQQALMRFAAASTTKEKTKKLLDSIDQISFMGAKITRKTESMPLTISDVLALMADGHQPILLLLDEVQELARVDKTSGLVRSLRTGLDVHKDKIKVIFTGSSITGLQALFNDSKAPFFHFAHHIDFPVLGRAFSDYLADIIDERTGQTVDREILFAAFERMQHTPMYLRAVAQDMILNPALSLADAVERRMAQFSEVGGYQAMWEKLSILDRAVLLRIATGETSLYARDNIDWLSAKTEKSVTTSHVQKALKRLSEHGVISKALQGHWIITEQAFQGWILETS